MKLIAVIASVCLAVPATLCAQDAANGPRAGAWGGEVGFDVDNAGLGGAVLRFRNDRSAWVLGLDGSVSREKRDSFFEDEVTGGSAMGRLGFRSFRSPGATVRTILGAGIIASTLHLGGIQRSWQAGVYGEFGVSRFFAPNFSVGLLSDLQLTHGERRGGTATMTETRLGFDALRMTATVIF